MIKPESDKPDKMTGVQFVFIIILTFHGLIHSLGFLKTFGYLAVNLKELNSKPFGLVWLAVSLFFLITAALVVLKNKYWCWLGLTGAVLSQFLVIVFWQDAKYATIVNLIVFVAAFIAFATLNYQQRYQRDVKKGLGQKPYFDQSELSEEDIDSLPELVKKYLRFCGSVGRPKVNNFKIEFNGKIGKDEHSEWMPFTSQQYNFMQTPTRLFFMKAVMKGVPIAGYHHFENGIAYMDIRLLSLFKVQYLAGPEMNLSETVTFFNDMCCLAPATLIDKRIKWLEVQENKVHASFTNNHITVSAWLYFAPTGELTNFISQDRYAADAGKQLPWSTPLIDYQQINGYHLMANAETIYSYPDRDLCYGTFKLIDVEYNCK